jgi:ferrochelatase
LSSAHRPDYDALLVVAFGGPEGPDEVLPFLERVLAGRDVPRARLLEVAAHYDRFGGVSPLNAQNRALVSAAAAALTARGIDMPVYLGNRNAPPYIEDALREMATTGAASVLALYTSPYGSYSSCRQYSRNLDEARAAVGPSAPTVHKLRAYFNHPGFVDAAAAVTRAALDAAATEFGAAARLVFTAHSIPTAMADAGPYLAQIREASRLVAEAVAASGWTLAFQSRSGPPTQAWLEPSLRDVIADHGRTSSAPLVVSPIGFLSDHMEVVYDIDVEAAAQAVDAGVRLRRAGTVGTHPRFLDAIVGLVEECLSRGTERATVGGLGAAPDICSPDCCAWIPARPPLDEGVAAGARTRSSSGANA